MITRKSACGLCKPHKKWKKNDTKTERAIRKEYDTFDHNKEEALEIALKAIQYTTK